MLAQGADSLWNTQITGQKTDGEPFTAEDLMTAEDLGQEDVLNHASSTNGLCIPAP